MERTVGSINGAGKIGQPYVKGLNWTLFYTKHKMNSNWIKDLNVKPESTKLPEGSRGRHLLDIGLDNGFLNLATKGKINKWNKIQLKSF